MPLTKIKLQKVSLSFIAVFLLYSCSKDSDLLSEYVIAKDDNLQYTTLVSDDIFFMSPDQNSILMDVLNNDSFSSDTQVTIISTSTPNNGDVTINEDNTLTYVAIVPTEVVATEQGPIEDTFTYTAEQTQLDGAVLSEVATVTVSSEIAEKKLQINFSTYGAKGDGIADDTKALQAALDAESNLIADSGATFLVSETLDIDTQIGQNIDWNNATITTSTPDLRFFTIDKRASNGGTTSMQDLLIDGNGIGMQGVTSFSRVNLFNIDGMDYGQSARANASPNHIQTKFTSNDADAHGDWVIDGCDVDGLLGYGNYCDYCDGIGAANGYLIYWEAVPNVATTMTFKNATVQNGFGPDGQNIGVFSPGIDVSYSAQTVFDNITTRGFDRRGWKVFCGGITVKNSLIQDNPKSEGLLICGNDGTGANCSQLGAPGTETQSSGLFTFGTGSGSTGSYNIRIENTTFVGVTNGTDNRIIPASTDDVIISNCIFEGGASIAFTTDMGDVDICSSTFNSGSSISSYNQRVDSGEIRLDTDNVYINGFANTVNIGVFSSIQIDLTCPPLN